MFPFQEVPEAYDYNGHAYHQHHLSGSQSDGSGGGTGGGGGGGCATPCSDAVMIKIDVPVPLRDEQRFPKEIGKTFVALLLVGFNLFLATVSLAVVHDKVPDRATYGPLPDFVLDNIPAVDWALDVSEILIMIVVNSCVLLITFHKHRFIVMRRVFLLMSLLYFMRSITMYVTVMPMSNTTYYCSPKAPNATAVIILKRAFQLFSGFGLSINGKHTYCGDYIYSGHTVTLVMGYLIIAECKSLNSTPFTAVVICLFCFYRFTKEVLDRALARVVCQPNRSYDGIAGPRPLHHRRSDCVLRDDATVLDLPHAGKQQSAAEGENKFPN